jgi:hypothetical protein
MALDRPVLHRISCSNKAVRDAQNRSFGSNGVDRLRSFRKVPTELRLANLFIKFFNEFRAVTKWFETPENKSFRFNRMDQVRSLQKISTHLRSANLGISGASLARLASTLVQ